MDNVNFATCLGQELPTSSKWPYRVIQFIIRVRFFLWTKHNKEKIKKVKKRTKIGVAINCIFDVHNKIKTPSIVMWDVKRTTPKKQVTQCGRENKHSSQTK